MAVSDPDSIKTVLEDVLTKVATVKDVKNFEMKPEPEALIGDGFVSQFYKGEVVNKDTGEIIKVAIKKSPTWEWDYTSIYKNEINFYEKVVPALQELQKQANLPNPFDNTPEYFTSQLGKKKEYIALEDLKPQGYILHDKKKCLDKQQLDFIFRTYGKFHALSFILKKQNSEKFKEIHQEYTDLFSLFVAMESSITFFRDALAAAIDAVDPKTPTFEVAKYLTQNIKTNLIKSFAYDGDYNCSTHGDCWSNNMLFKYSDGGKLENIKLVDFQLARQGTPIHDLSYFFYSGASKADFDAIEDYLRIYHNSLSEVIRHFGENPEEIFPFDALIREWKENALLGVYLGIYLWQIKLTSKEELVDALKSVDAKQTEKSGASIEEATKMFSDLMAKGTGNSLYQQRTRDILTHAFEYGVLRKEKLALEEENSATSDNASTDL